MNISLYEDLKTASTNRICAKQRAEFLKQLGIRKVLELCVGPSLKILQQEYDKQNIECWGNDIDKRWKNYYQNSNWFIDDAFNVVKEQYRNFDAIVFAPPLSKGCSGKRNDSLSIFEVKPNYLDFIKLIESLSYHGIIILTLPGKTWSNRKEKTEYYKLLSYLYGKFEFEPLELFDGCRKYIDLILHKS